MPTTTVCRVCGEADRPNRRWRRVCRGCEIVAGKRRRHAAKAMARSDAPATISPATIETPLPAFVERHIQ